MTDKGEILRHHHDADSKEQFAFPSINILTAPMSNILLCTLKHPTLSQSKVMMNL